MARRLLGLRERWRDKLQRESGSSNLLALIDLLFLAPVTTISEASSQLKLTYRGAQLNVEKLESRGFLVEVTGNQRHKRYMAVPIVDIVGEDQA